MATAAKPQRLKLTTPEFRGSYVHLVKPRAIEEGQEPKYSMCVVLPKRAKETIAFIDKLKKAIDAATLAKFGKVMPHATLKHFPIRDGDAMGKEGFADCWCITASNKYKPQVMDTRGEEVIEERALYSGAMYRASVSAWAWAHKTGGKGISINLESVLKVSDGERIGGGSKASEDFAEFIDADGAADVAGEPTGEDDALLE
jgi:hypothetical protein